MSTVPDLSIVIASFSGPKMLRRCLESLEPQWAGAEVIVPTDVDLVASAHLSERFPTVRFILADKGTSVFRLRTLGVEVARGRFVAISEDHVTFGPQWTAEMRKALSAGHEVVGGPIDNGRDTLYDWALYASEYITFMPPQPDGPAAVLSGVNIAYSRRLLDQTRPIWRDTFRENEVNDELRKHNVPFHRAGNAIVASHLDMNLRVGMDHLFGGGRHYGRYRKTHATPVQRLLLPLGIPLVPAVLTWRILRAAMTRRPKILGRLLLGLPYTTGLVGAWTAGEALGYLLPLPDDAQPQPAAQVQKG